MRSLFRQHASALLSALLIVSIVAAMATVMILQRQMDINRSQIIFDRDQQQLKHQDATAWASHYLITSLLDSHLKKHVEKIPATFHEKFAEGTVTARLSDEQSGFNLNDFQTPQNLPRLIRLIRIVMPDVSDARRKTIGQALSQWLSNKPGSYDDYYKLFKPPYAPAHTLMVSRSEFRLVYGVNEKIYHALKPYLHALPIRSKININTASAAVIASLAPGISIDTAEAAVDFRRQNHGFKNMSELTNYPGIDTQHVDSKDLTRNSDFFLLKTRVSYHNETRIFTDLVARHYEKHQIHVTILWSSHGSY